MPARRWATFSLRTMFVTMAVFGCWLAYQLNWIRQRHNAPVLHARAESIDILAGPKAVIAEVDAPWPLNWFGERGYVALGVDEKYGEQEIERVRRLFPEAEVGEIPSDLIEPEDRPETNVPATH